MSNIIPFTFPETGQQVRVIGDNESPLFHHGDVCKVLQHTNPSVAARMLDEDESVMLDLRDIAAGQTALNSSYPTPATGNTEARFVTEPGLYSLILRSNLPQAKAFKRWLTHEVIPQIRKTGSYSAAPAALTNRDLARMVLEEADRADAAEQKVAELEPMAAQAAHYRSADGLTAVGDFANDIKGYAKQQLGVRVLHSEVWNFLGEIGLIIRGNTVRHNEPTAFATENDYVRPKRTEFETNTRGLQASSSPRLTPAGAGFAWDRALRRLAEHNSLRKDDGRGFGVIEGGAA